MVFLCLLRVGSGWLFLYEGLSKYNDPNFSSVGYLSQAKGPFAERFQAMLPDPTGRERLTKQDLDNPELYRVSAEPVSEVWKDYVIQLNDKLDALADKQKGSAAAKAADDKPADSSSDESDGASDEADGASDEAGGSPGEADGEDSAEGESGGDAAADGEGAEKAPAEAAEGEAAEEASQEAADEAKEAELQAELEAEEADYADRARFTDKQYDTAMAYYEDAKWKLEEYLDDHAESIRDYLHELQRLEKQEAELGDAHFQQKRNWDKRAELRRMSGPWLAKIDDLSERFRRQVDLLLNHEQREAGPPDAPLLPDREEKRQSMARVDRMVTLGTLAIGVCLMVGLFTRVACLAGVVFLMLVILPQPAWEAFYSPPNPAAGNAMIVNKEFIMMLSLLALAATPVGRWGGLDFFIYRLYRACCGGKSNESES